MKKILSVMLAIMMIFGALSVSASAAVTNEEMIKEWNNTSETIIIKDKSYAKREHVVLQLNFNGGTSYTTLPAYDTLEGNFVYEKVSDYYLMLPGCGIASLMPGTYVTLPLVTAAEGDDFQGWYCVETGQLIAGGDNWKIPENSGGMMYNFTAKYYPAESDGDTLAMIMGILMKVFGTIIGVLFLDGSSAAGVELMEKMLGGLLG